MGWLYFEPNYEHIYKIIVYDDGNQRYQQYGNEWHLDGTWMALGWVSVP